MYHINIGRMGEGVPVARKIWTGILTLFLIAALVLAALFTGVRLFGLTPYTVTSGSMEPVYPVGSMIYVKPVDPEDVQVGQAITFHLNASTVATHQVWAIEGETFRTQGIANRDSEGNVLHDAAPVPFDALIGKPVACIPYLGFLYAAIRTPVGVCALIFLGAGICLASLFMDSGNSAPPRKGGKRLQNKGTKKESDTV